MTFYVVLDGIDYELTGDILLLTTDKNKAWAFNETYNFENKERGIFSEIQEYTVESIT